jgi:hypothetical protein
MSGIRGLTAVEYLSLKTAKSESGCIEWIAGLDRKGYGQAHREGKHVSAHRLSWEIVNGAIPTGLCVLHSCDNPKCCNVEHLRLGTQADNSADCTTRGRQTSIS